MFHIVEHFSRELFFVGRYRRTLPSDIIGGGQVSSSDENLSAANPPVGTQAVDRAAALLVTILESSEAPSFGDLQSSSGLAKSTLSRLLSSL